MPEKKRPLVRQVGGGVVELPPGHTMSMGYLPINVFEVNDVVKCIKTVTFVDGHIHEKGTTHVVTQATLSYFNMNAFDYILWQRGT